MRVLDLQYLAIDRDRHGNLRTYVRIGRKKIRIREKRGTEAFLEKYKEAVRLLTHPGEPERDVIKPARAGTVGWLAAKYFGSVEFQSLDPVSQRTRRAIIDECLREPLKPGSADLIRDCPLSAFSTAHVKMLRDRKAKTPGAATVSITSSVAP